jgi:hypothetical protein
MLHRRLIDQRLTIFADAVSTFIIALNANTTRFVTLRADKHNIRDVQGCFELDASGVNGPTLGLNLALVFGMHVYTLHHHPMLIWQDFDHLAAFALFFNFSADDFNGIPFSDLDSHRSLLNWPKALPGPAKQSS